jgi:anti-sigma-K factor RskA
MRDADVHALAGAYALDAVDDLERVAFEHHLAECETCRGEAGELRRTAVRLAEAVAVPPPERVRAAVLAEAGRTPQVRSRVSGRVDGAPGRRRPGALVAAAAVLLVGVVGAGGLAAHEHALAEQARQQAATISSVVSDPGARTVRGAAAGGGTVTVVLAGNRAVLATAGMPRPPGDRIYQLWLVRPGAITSAGLGPGAADAADSWSRLVGGVRAGDVVAISVEPPGGSRQPTTRPVATLQV